MQFPDPQQQHQWLQQLLGEWTWENEATCPPDAPPTKFTGAESVRPLGAFWVLAEGQGEMPGGGMARMVMTLGYNPKPARFVGTWVGSMMPHLWVYEGDLDESTNTLTLNAQGPAMDGSDRLLHYQDIIQILSPDHRTLSSQVRGADGNWNRFMVAHYYRRR